jgi:hypothetical protein
MNNKDEILKVVGIEVPNGGVCQGTKVKLSNGQYLTGIQSITLRGDTNSKLWSLSLEMRPDFVDQQTIEAVLANIKLVKSEQASQRKEAIRKQVELLQVEYAYLGKYAGTTQDEKKAIPPEIQTPPIKLE